MLKLHNIKDVPTTINNTQANAICERMHQTIGNMLRTLIYQHQPHNQIECEELMETAIASTIFALRSTVHTSLGTTPGIIAFHRDMLLNVPVIADLQAIQEKRQQLVARNNQRQNARRHTHTYNINDLVLLAIPTPKKLQERFQGPYKILQVHNNGTLTIKRDNNISQRINLRRIKPYRQF